MRHEIENKDEAIVRERVQEEYELFSYKMKSKSRIEIFNKCIQIGFYSCIYEYFKYAEEISQSHVMVCMKYKNPIAAMYDVYMYNERFRYGKWEDIKEILDYMLEKENMKKAS